MLFGLYPDLSRNFSKKRMSWHEPSEGTCPRSFRVFPKPVQCINRNQAFTLVSKKVGNEYFILAMPTSNHVGRRRETPSLFALHLSIQLRPGGDSHLPHLRFFASFDTNSLSFLEYLFWPLEFVDNSDKYWQKMDYWICPIILILLAAFSYFNYMCHVTIAAAPQKQKLVRDVLWLCFCCFS